MKDPPKSPWASTKDDVGVRTRRRGILAGQTPTPAPVIQESSPVADNQDKPRTTGLGKGKTGPPSIRREPPKARQSVKTGVRKPHRNNRPKFKKSKTHTGAALDKGNGVRKTPVDDEGQSKTEDKNPVGKAPIEDGEHATSDQKDPVGKTPVEDQEPSMTDEKHQVGKTPVEDQEQATLAERPDGDNAGGSDSESDSPVERPEVEELSRTGMVANLIAAVALKGLLLPTLGDGIPQTDDPSLFFALAGTQESFSEHGDFLSFNDPVKQATQFATITQSIVLKKKETLKRSLQGHTISALLCTVAELIPQLETFSDMDFGTKEHRRLRTKTCWDTFISMMEAAVGVGEPGFVFTNWSPAGMVALEKLDTFAKSLFNHENLIAMRFVDTDWLKNDLERLHLVAYMANDGFLEPTDYFLKETTKAIEDFFKERGRRLEQRASEGKSPFKVPKAIELYE